MAALNTERGDAGLHPCQQHCKGCGGADTESPLLEGTPAYNVSFRAAVADEALFDQGCALLRSFEMVKCDRCSAPMISCGVGIVGREGHSEQPGTYSEGLRLTVFRAQTNFLAYQHMGWWAVSGDSLSADFNLSLSTCLGKFSVAPGCRSALSLWPDVQSFARSAVECRARLPCYRCRSHFFYSSSVEYRVRCRAF